MTAEAATKAGKPKTQPRNKDIGVSSRRIYLLFGVNLIGFALIFLIDAVVGNLLDDLNRDQNNERSHVLIGELLSSDLSRLQAKAFQLATTTGEKRRARVKSDIETVLEQLKDSLRVLEHGGEIVRETRLNIESQATMIRKYSYTPTGNDRYVLEVIDLAPKLDTLWEKVNDLSEKLSRRDALQITSGDTNHDHDEYLHAIDELKRTLQSLPPLFIRMKENANRLFYESQQELKKLQEQFEQRKSDFLVAQTVLSLTIIVVVLWLGFVVIRQISHSNRQLSELARNLEFQKYALDQHAIVSITDTTGKITYVNDRFCELSGYKAEELLGQNHRIVRSAEHSAEFFKEMWQTISSGHTWHGEVKNRNKNGSTFWVNATIVPFLDSSGKPFQYIAIRTDITGRKEMEEEINERNSFFTSLTGALGEGVYAMDADDNITFLNPEAERLLGWSQDELLERGVHDSVHNQLDEHGHREPKEACRILKVTKNNEIYRSDLEEFVRKDGTVFPVSLVSVPLMDEGSYAGAVTVFQDNTERMENARLMSEAKEEAEKANRAKSEFLSSMSHELRTPLNAILGFSQLLELEELAEEQLESVKEIHTAGDHLLDLVNEILDLAKIEAGKVELEMETVELDEILQKSIRITAPLAENRGIGLIQNFEKSGLVVYADPMRLKQVLLNLLSNGVKYNRESGTLTLAVAPSEDGRSAIIRVTDTGAGLTDEQQQHLFKPFERLEQESGQIEGTGIGLVIARNLLTMMDGDIGVESEPGVGSTFWLSIPLARDNAATREQGQGEVEPLEESSDVVTDDELRILYIDDNAVNLKLVDKYLSKREEIDLKTTKDPFASLELAKTFMPKMILLDISMPGMDGYEVLEQLRSEPSTSGIPVIALSANAMKSDIDKALAAGFVDYITKPVDINQLFDMVDKWSV